MRREERAYLAGLFDGEGGVTAARSKQGFYPRTYMGTVEERVMRWVRKQLGGTLTRRVFKASYNRRPMWYVIWTHKDDVRRVLTLLLPWLKIKRRVAEAGVELAGLIQDAAHKRQVRAETRRKRKMLHDRIKRLNGRVTTV